MVKGIVTDFHGSSACHTAAESYCKEYSYRYIQGLKKKILS